MMSVQEEVLEEVKTKEKVNNQNQIIEVNMLKQT